MTDSSIQARAQRLMSEVPLIDGHNDLPIQLRLHFKNQINDESKCSFREGLFTETDLVKLKQGHVGGQFWSVFIECAPEKENPDWNDDDVCFYLTFNNLFSRFGGGSCCCC